MRISLKTLSMLALLGDKDASLACRKWFSLSSDLNERFVPIIFWLQNSFKINLTWSRTDHSILLEMSAAYNYITKAIAKTLPKLYSTDGSGYEAIARLKLFTPDGDYTWYVTEYDPNTETCFGLVKGLETELGYFSLKEIRNLRGPMGLPVERDLYFSPKPLNELI